MSKTYPMITSCGNHYSGVRSPAIIYQKRIKMSKTYPMIGGDGPHSYAKNSSIQGKVIDTAKDIISETIAAKLDVQGFSKSTFLGVADLGCSVGPNTFSAVHNIVDAIVLKYRAVGLESHIPEFQVFFSDLESTDFNMLFNSLAPNRRYYVAGVPGSFYGRLFPTASLHFVHSSCAIHWLSSVPKEVTDINSPAWNKGRIHYSTSPQEVSNAYLVQFTKDMQCFLHARAQEIICGGLMALTIPGRFNNTPHSEGFHCITWDLLGSCLMDMAKNGRIEDEKVNFFSVPTYIPSPQEVIEAVGRNECFSVERIENLPHDMAKNVPHRAKLQASHHRAAMETLIEKHFGVEIIDELFESLANKLEVSNIFDIGQTNFIFVLLKRNTT